MNTLPYLKRNQINVMPQLIVKLFHVLNLAVILCNITQAQTWNKTVTHGGNESLGLIVQPDSTIYTLNKSNFYPNGITTIMKFDNNGNRLFDREMAQSTASSTTNNPKDVAPLLNGNFVYCGAAGGAGVDWLVRRQNNTNAIWTRRFNYVGYSGGIAEAVVTGIDSTIVTVGSFNDSSIYRPTICNIDYSGNTDWIATVEGINSFSVVDVIQTNDSGYVMLGTTSDYGQGGQDIFTLKFNTNGGLEWAKTMGGSSDETAKAITLDANGNMYVLATSNSYGTDAINDLLILQLDQNGNSIQTKAFENSTDELSAYDIIQMANGIALSYVEFSSEQQVGVMHLDANLNILWNYTYGHVNRDEGRPKLAYVPYDRGFVMNAQAYDNNKSMFLRGDSTGFVSDCNMFDGKSMIESAPNITITNIIGSLNHKYIPLIASGGTGISYSKNRNITNHHFVIDTVINDITCAGLSDGEISSTVTLATGIVTHTWSTGQQDVGNMTSTITGLAAGNYTYELSDDNNCTFRAIMTIEEPLPLMVQVSGDDSPCYGQAMGSAWVNVSQGTAPYSYLWTNGSITDTIYNLNQGTYSVTVSDDRGCLGAGSYFVNQASQLDFSLNGANVICSGDSTGSIIANTNGGTSPFNYSWNTGQSVSSISGIPANTYTLTVQDACGATLQDSIQITEPLPLTGNVTTIDVDCNGGADGSASVYVSEGTLPYNYIWSNSSSTINTAINLSASNPLDSVTIVDACSDSVSIPFVVSEPDILTVNVITEDASCHNSGNGLAYADVQGGTQPYSYLWNIIQTTDTISNLFPATYTVNVTDAKGCFTTNTGTVSSPSAISGQFIYTHPTCNQTNGEIDVIPGGGTAPYYYQWSNGDTDSIAENLSDGYYSLLITDDNGCTNYFDSTDINSLQTFVNPVEICLATVDTITGRNQLIWEQPSGVSIAGYNIYRNVAGVYTLQAFWPSDSLSQWVDYTFGVDPTITSYRYKLSAVDSCGNESTLSDFHETIHLATNIGVGNSFNLVWDNYEGFNFTHYRILWDSLGNGNWQVLDSVPNTNFTYTHSTSAINPTYNIEVVAPSTCASNRANHNTTRSNRTTPISNGGNSTNIQELEFENFNLFPNPNNGEFTINFYSPIGGDGVYKIYDSYGKMAVQQLTSCKLGYNEFKLLIDDISAGLYILTFELNSHISNHKFYVHK